MVRRYYAGSFPGPPPTPLRPTPRTIGIPFRSLHRITTGVVNIGKGSFEVMETTDRMHWLLATAEGFYLYMDHHNLTFLCYPIAVVPEILISSTRKVLRWAVRFIIYNYTCVHIKRIDNVWADIIGRWSQPATLRRIVKIPELSSSDAEDFQWPNGKEIAKEQAEHDDVRPNNLELESGLWVNSTGSVWIPDDSTDLQMRLCVIAHTEPSGHRGGKSTEFTLKNVNFWCTLSMDVNAFTYTCIHCLSTTGREKVQHLLCFPRLYIIMQVFDLFQILTELLFITDVYFSI